MACHARIATSNAVLGFPEATLGLIPGWGGTQFWKFIPKINKEKFIEYMKTSVTFNAQEALNIGLIDSIINSEVKIPATANSPKRYSKSSVVLIEKMLDKTINNTNFHFNLSVERESFAIAMTSPDAREGIAAFLEKRTPNFE